MVILKITEIIMDKNTKAISEKNLRDLPPLVRLLTGFLFPKMLVLRNAHSAIKDNIISKNTNQMESENKNIYIEIAINYIKD